MTGHLAIGSEESDMEKTFAQPMNPRQPAQATGNNRPPWDALNVHHAFAVGADAGELLQVGSTRMRILEGGLQIDNRMGAMVTTMPAGGTAPPLHRHLMFDETFLITRGTVRFSLGKVQKNLIAGDYVVVPAGAWHTFANASDDTIEFFGTCTPAYYTNYFRELSRLSGEGRLTPEANVAVMKRYATEVYSVKEHGDLPL
jgi:quercetin dioxygenase-like cupin family protein